jgi:hypothetical protein
MPVLKIRKLTLPLNGLSISGRGIYAGYGCERVDAMPPLPTYPLPRYGLLWSE